MASFWDSIRDTVRKADDKHYLKELRQYQRDNIEFYASTYLDDDQDKDKHRAVVNAIYEWLAERTDGVQRKQWARWSAEVLELRCKLLTTMIKQQVDGWYTGLDAWLDARGDWR